MMNTRPSKTEKSTTKAMLKSFLRHPDTDGVVDTDHAGNDTPLSKYISIEGRFSRSVNLERDFYQDISLDGYVCSAAVQEALKRVWVTLHHSHSLMTRAWTLIGPYGGGKSAFALFLSKLFSSPLGNTNPAYKRLLAAKSELAPKLKKLNPQFVPVLISGTRESLASAILRGLAGADLSAASKSVRDKVKEMAASEIRVSKLPASRDAKHNTGAGKRVQSAEVGEVIRALASSLAKNNLGLLIVIDELGKILEYTANHPNESDIFLLQQLAEFANQGSDSNMILLTILHQNFDSYARSLSDAQRKEWSKVQGRFEDISFAEPKEQMIALLSQAMTWKPAPEADMTKLDEQRKRLGEIGLRLAESVRVDIPPLDFGTAVEDVFPIHPATAVVMPTLFRKVGQNQRSIFSFLASREPFGFQEFIGRTDAFAAKPYLRLPDIYDYLKHTLSGNLYDANLRLWTQIDSALDRLTPDGEQYELEVRLIKSIGVLMLAGGSADIKASLKFLSFACDDKAESKKVKEALERLAKKSIVIYRKYKDVYALYEGSDIDIDELITKAHDQVQFYESLTTFMADDACDKLFSDREEILS